jgi:chromosome segregation ATPase
VCAAGVERNLEMTETQRHHLEDEVRSLYRERSELVEQLNIVLRQKNALAEEVLGLRRENDRQGDTIGRLVKEKEDLAKDKAEHVVQITACERDNRQLSEVPAE